MSKAVFTLFILLLSIKSAHAIAIPPAAIDEDQLQPECVTVQPSYLFGQGQVYGTDGKGPAIRIENGCKTSITIENISTGAAKDTLKRLVSVDAGLLTDKALLTKAEPFIFVPAGGDCATVRVAQKKAQEEHAQKIAEHKSQLDKAASAEELLEQANKAPAAKPDNRDITCNSITLQPGGLLALAMPWETTYLVTGSPDVKIAGQMINPLDVNSPETFQFAQNGDKATRYMLAVHNIETGQNLKLALRWLNEAAEQGYRPAIFELQRCYETGTCGVAKDEREALFWHVLGRGDIEPDGELYKRLDAWQKTHPEVTDY